MAEQDTDQAQAAAQTDDTSGQVADTQAEKVKPFTPEQEQYLGSWMGRIVARQFDEKVAPHLRQQPQQQPPANQDEMMKQFNERVGEKIFSGNAVEAVDMVLSLKEQAKQNLSQTQNMNLLRILTTYTDQPYYEDINQEIHRLAKEKLSEGAPPDKAVKWAYAEAKGNYLEDKMKTGDRDTSNLGLTGGGRQLGRQKVAKLPPEFQRAMERDIRDGIFKDQADYIKSLNPKVRERIGL
uniref:Capsid assembly protein n=1 Tax=viral metagenome TaxID=1070528 RepID=A0A6H1Z5P5_9ZZZZ